MKKVTQNFCLISLITAMTASIPVAKAATNVWTGASGTDLNWSTPGNWTPAGPPGATDDAIFLDQGATNDTATINNIVSADAAVQSIWIGPTNGSPTNVESFNTSIQPGVTLTVAGTNALTDLAAFENVGSPTSPATYLVGTLDYVAVDTTVMNTITGPTGALVLDNTNNFLIVREGNGSSGDHLATLDLSGLNSFTANLEGVQVGVGDTTYRRAVGTLILAQTNTITVRGDDGTPGIFVGNAHGNNNGNSSHADLVLGQNNVVNADWLRIGGEKQQGMMYFNTGLSPNPSLMLRGSGGGTNRVTEFAIGDEHHQGSSGNPTTGTVDLTGGTADILADTIYVGRSQTGSNGREATGILQLGAGTMDVNTLELGYEDTPNGDRSGNPYTASGELDVDGATVVVNDLLRLGREDGAPLPQVGVLNINSGSVTANGAFSIEGVADITLTGGLLDLPPHSSILGDMVMVSGGTISNVDVLQATNTLIISSPGVIASPETFEMGPAGIATWDVSGTPSAGLTVSDQFSGAGVLYGDLTMALGSTLSPGDDGGVNPLYLNNNLTLNGANLDWDLSSSAGSGSDQISISGNLTLGATNDVEISSLSGSLDTSNPYTLIAYGGTLTGDATYFRASGPLAQSRFTFNFGVANNNVTLSVGGPGPADLLWVGNGTDNNWDLKNTADWNNGSGSDQFYNLDNVTFDDSGSATPAVNLSGTLYPGAITMNNNTKAYVFSGTGSLAGGSLTNYGSGGLTISNEGTNALVGIEVENGNVTLAGGSLNQLGAGGVLLNSGTASLTIANTNGDDFGPAGIVLNGGTLTFDQPADETLTANISGSGTVTKSNSNTLTLVGDNSALSSQMTVAEGTIKLNSASVVPAGGLVVNDGGALDVNGQDLSDSSIIVTAVGAGPNGTGAIVNSGPDQIHTFSFLTLDGDTTLGGSGRWDVRGSSSTPAALNLNGGGYNITKVGSNEVALVDCSVDPSLGNVDVQEGEFAIQNTTAENGGVGDTTKTITVRAGALLETYGLGAAYPLNKLITLQDGAFVQNDHDVSVLGETITLQGNAFITANSDFIFTNVVTGSGGLTTIGGSTLVLSALNDYSGATVVSNGTVQVDGVVAGSGVDVEGGALAGLGTITSLVSVKANGDLSPGDGSIGTLTINNNLTLAGTCTMDLNKTNSVFTNDLVTGVSTLQLGGTLQLNITGDALADGDSFTLFSASTINGSFDGITPSTPGTGLAWQMNGGVLSVITAPPQGPTIGSPSVSNGNLTFTISGGGSGASFYILTSTNLAAPIATWTPLETNQFDNNGNFDFTNSVDGQPQQFFIIQLQ